MAESTETFVLNTHHTIASLIREFTDVRHDHLGPYISINRTDGEDRRFALDDGEAGDDLNRYFWSYENRTRKSFVESQIPAHASDKEVVEFIADILAAETK